MSPRSSTPIALEEEEQEGWTVDRPCGIAEQLRIQVGQSALVCTLLTATTVWIKKEMKRKIV